MFDDFFAPWTFITSEIDSHKTFDNDKFIGWYTIDKGDHRHCDRHRRQPHMLHWFDRPTVLLDSALYEIQTRHRPWHCSAIVLIAFELSCGRCTTAVFVNLPTVISSQIPARVLPSARTDQRANRLTQLLLSLHFLVKKKKKASPDAVPDPCTMRSAVQLLFLSPVRLSPWHACERLACLIKDEQVVLFTSFVRLRCRQQVAELGASTLIPMNANHRRA